MKTKSFYHLPLSSLQWLLTGLFLAALPLCFQLPIALLFGFLGCLLWRFVLERKGLKCPRMLVRWGVGVVGLLMILGLLETVIGLTGGMALLLLLIALKVLEMRTEREFMLLGFLAFFILLTSLFFSQTFLVCLYVCLVFLVLTATLVQFTGGATEGLRLHGLLRYTFSLLLQALPLIILLFVFLPRFKGGSLLQLNKPKSAQSGMSDQINPGNFAELALNEDVAFRADFPDGPVPPYGELYWRVGVFTQCDGLIWRTSRGNHDPVAEPKITGPLVAQRISMEPHSGVWAYALDRPVSGGNLTQMTSGNVLSLKSSTSERVNILVTSKLGNDLTPLSERARIFYTDVPDDVGDRSRLLVRSWLEKTSDPKEIVKLAENLFRKENFRYTLSPGVYPENGLDIFLFERRLGFCEHYTAAFATLMRIAKIPTRMVAGYHGGEQNSFGNYLIVRQADAHAWAEIWLEKEGWVRIDPTDFINPLRIDANTPLAARFPAESGVESERGSGRLARGLLQSLFHGVQLGWDTVNFQWNLHIVSYDQESQRDFYRSLGISSLLSWKLLTILGGGLLIFLGGVYLLVRQKPARLDPSLLLYRRYCQILARAGLPRLPSEGPRDYASRASAHFPGHEAILTDLFARFIALRYGPASLKEPYRQISHRLHTLRRTLRANPIHPPILQTKVD